MVSGLGWSGFDRLRTILYRRWVSPGQACTAARLLYLDEFLLRLLRDLHALAGVPRAQPRSFRIQPSRPLTTTAKPAARASSGSGYSNGWMRPETVARARSRAAAARGDLAKSLRTGSPLDPLIRKNSSPPPGIVPKVVGFFRKEIEICAPPRIVHGVFSGAHLCLLAARYHRERCMLQLVDHAG